MPQQLNINQTPQGKLTLLIIHAIWICLVIVLLIYGSFVGHWTREYFFTRLTLGPLECTVAVIFTAGCSFIIAVLSEFVCHKSLLQRRCSYVTALAFTFLLLLFCIGYLLAYGLPKGREKLESDMVTYIHNNTDTAEVKEFLIEMKLTNTSTDDEMKSAIHPYMEKRTIIPGIVYVTCGVLIAICHGFANKFLPKTVKDIQTEEINVGAPFRDPSATGFEERLNPEIAD